MPDENPEHGDESVRASTIHDRRGFLKGAAAVAAATGLSSMAAGATGEETRTSSLTTSVQSSDFSPPADEPIDRSAMTERHLNVSDGEDLSTYLENSSPGELLVVPPGDYEWSGQVSHSYDDWGVQGDPDADGEATIWLDDGWGYGGDGILLNLNGNNTLIENIRLDSTGRTSPGFRLDPSGGNALAHYIIDYAPGPTDSSIEGNNTFLLGGSAPGHIMIDRCVQHQRATIAYDNSSQSFLWCATDVELTVRRCKASGMGDNIVYTRMPGPMTVENCVFANTTPSSIRLGGDNEVVRNCTFWLDTDGRELYETDGLVNTRSIAPDNASGASNGGHVENCSFICESTPSASGVIASIGDNTWLDIEDCQFLLNQGDIDGIVMGGASVTVENTEFVTTNDSGATAGAAGSFTTSNVGVDTGLDSGSIAPDYTNVSFDWDDAHDFPDPTTEEAFRPVGETGDNDDDDDDDDDSGEPPEYPVIEDFERDSPLADYGGDTDQFTMTGSAYEGDAALENASGDFGGVNSTSGLDTYPERGDEFEVYLDNAGEENFAAVNFFAQAEAATPDRYSVGLSGVSGDFTLWKTEGGDIDTLDSSAPSDTASGWYRIEISTDSSTVSADLYDEGSGVHLASVSASDSAHSSGGIGFRSAGNGEVFGYAVFEDEDGPDYDVVEDFERADPLSEYGGSEDLFDTTSASYEGDAALINDSGEFGSAVSTSGLDSYPERGDDVVVYFDNASEDNFMAFMLFAGSESNVPDSYMIGISGHGYWRIWRVDNGDLTVIAETDLTGDDQIDGWYRVEIGTDASTISADLYDDGSDELVASVSADDSTYDSGGIGFRSAGNGERWDHVIREE